MAKRSVLGVITGKLGNMVGQKNSLVSSKDKQVWRVYNGTVKNPKTVKQAMQRALFVSAKNFKQALAAILDHSWQGVEYGTKSLNHFESMVLANGGANFPGFIIQPKGSQDAIPQPFPVSRGSIPVDTSIGFYENDSLFTPGIAQVELAQTDTTYGAAWTKLLAANPALKDGDMITFVTFVSDSVAPDGYNTMYPVFDRFIIDTNDTTALADSCIISQKGIFEFVVEGDDGINGIIVRKNVGSFGYMGAAAVIISRQKGSKASWLRSNSDLVVDDGFTTWLMTQEYVNATLESYMSSSKNAESDWYLNETGDNNNGQTTDPGLVTPLTLNLSNGTTTMGCKYKYRNKEGFLYLPAGNLGGYSHQTIKYVIQGMTITPFEGDAGVYITGPGTGVKMTDVFDTLVAKGYNVTLVP